MLLRLLHGQAGKGMQVLPPDEIQQGLRFAHVHAVSGKREYIVGIRTHPYLFRFEYVWELHGVLGLM